MSERSEPPERRARVYAVLNMAIPVGAALGYIVGGQVSDHFGWRAAFYVAGVPGLLLALTVLRLPDPPRASVARKSLLHSVAQGLAYINRDSALRSLCLVAAALNFCLAGPVSIGLAWIAKTQSTGRRSKPLATGQVTMTSSPT